MSFLHSVSQWLIETLEPWGAPGLMLIAICDSSFLSLPEVNDAALMALSINNPLRMWEMAAMTVVGSVIGCLLLYGVGRKGGEAMLKKRFAADKIVRVRGWYQKYGMLAVIVPSLLPPPLPFKIFVLSAGAFQVPWLRFVTAVAIGRSIRYFAEGLLAVWYGKRALQIVADNFPIVGLVLAVLIVAGAFVYVYMRRRRMNSSLILLPLLFAVFSGCVTKRFPPPPPVYPITKQEAISKLESTSKAINSLATTIRLSGSTATLKDKNTRVSSPIALNATLLMSRPNRISLVGGVPLKRLFEMVSDGTKYQVYNNSAEELYVDGLENGPPSKPIPSLGDMANQFVVGMKPRRLQEALMINVLGLLQNPSVRVFSEPVFQDRRRYLLIGFLDVSSPTESTLLGKIWFDLSTPERDIVRRQSYTATGDLDTDIRYSGHESLGASLRYPSKVDIRFYDPDTLIEIGLEPTQAEFNTDIPDDKFRLAPHPDAKVFKFEPRDAGSVSQQR
jgi:membrane protein YqaA with SNARE-associated domain/outer membrane lipoprotein-sorting protein